MRFSELNLGIENGVKVENQDIVKDLILYLPTEIKQKALAKQGIQESGVKKSKGIVVFITNDYTIKGITMDKHDGMIVNSAVIPESEWQEKGKYISEMISGHERVWVMYEDRPYWYKFCVD